MQVAEAIKAGIEHSPLRAELVLLPIADGGEGTVDAIVTGTGGRFMKTRVTGPLGDPVEATWGIHGDGKIAVIEMAAASGLPLVPPENRNPLLTTTFGTGELIRAALDVGCRKFIIGLGGSATNDAGAGMAQALGARLLDSSGNELGPGGGALLGLDRIDISAIDSRISQSEFLVACDVTNPLCGLQGASHVYGPQKGATPDMVNLLDKALARFAQIVVLDLGRDIIGMEGAGAAGGLGAGCMVFLNASLRSGTEIVFESIGFREKMIGHDLVITGEGRLDNQTIQGKTPIGVAKMAKESGIPVVAIVGGTSDDYHLAYVHGIDAVISIPPRPVSLEECQSRAAEFISETAQRLARLLNIGVVFRDN